MNDQSSEGWLGPIKVEPVVEISGDHRDLRRFEVIPRHDGTVLLKTQWSIGEPIAYAPKHWEEEYLSQDEAKARVAAYIDEFCETFIIG